jgi:hypothetical protein
MFTKMPYFCGNFLDYTFYTFYTFTHLKPKCHTPHESSSSTHCLWVRTLHSQENKLMTITRQQRWKKNYPIAPRYKDYVVCSTKTSKTILQHARQRKGEEIPSDIFASQLNYLMTDSINYPSLFMTLLDEYCHNLIPFFESKIWK